MTKQLTLTVNETLIPTDYFVESFIDHTVGGILGALEGTQKIETLVLTIKKDDVNIYLNGAGIPINPFVNKIIGNTIKGMVSSLKGVNEINSLKLNIEH